MFCRHCEYNLHGLPENRCPECGHTFDPRDPKTYRRHSASVTRRRWAKRILVALLTLLILATAAGVSLWYPWHREQAAVRMVQRNLSYFYTTTIGPLWLQSLLSNRGRFLLQRVDNVCIEDSAVTDTELASLKAFTHLRLLELSGNSKMTPAGLVNLAGLRQLQRLDLCRMKAADADLVNLKNLRQLQTLNLYDTQVTNGGLEHLKNLKDLTMLSLERTGVTDAGLTPLEGMKQLTILDLADTRVTDAGLVNLKNLKQLKELWLENTQVTDAGVTELKKALPACVIYH